MTLVAEQLHTFDGIDCEKCGRVHDLHVHDIELPTKVQQDLSQLLDQLDSKLLDQAQISNDDIDMFGLAESFLTFASVVQRMNTSGPVVMAILDVLDAEQNGAVSRRIEVYQAEQQLFIAHLMNRIFNNFVMELPTKVKTIPAQIQKQLDNILGHTMQMVEMCATKYRDVCYKYELPIDEEVIACGQPSAERGMAKELLHEAIETLLDVQAMNSSKDTSAIKAEVERVLGPSD